MTNAPSSLAVQARDTSHGDTSTLSSLANRLVLFGGRGGVGKTVYAASLANAWAQAHPRRPIALLSIDPAHSITDAFAGEPLPPNLSLDEIDAGQALRTFKATHDATLAEIAKRGTFLDEEDIHELLALSTPGLDELLALLHIPERLAAEPDLRIILDTAPYGHMTRLLESLWSAERWIDALDALLAKHRFLAQSFSGRYTPDATDALIADLRTRTQRLQRLLTSDVCRVVVVAVAEPLCLRESLDLIAVLRRRAIPTGPLIINRVHARSECPRCSGSRAAQLALISSTGLQELGVELLLAPLLSEEPLGRRGLAQLLRATGDLLDQAPPPASSAPLPRAHQGRPLDPSTQLLLVTGKGGVGKTSVATAVALAAASSSREVVLLSADPAPSLTNALARPITPTPTTIEAGLSAQILDAEGTWDAWCKRYEDELHVALSERLGGLDLTFDRAVLERLLDLTPPGIDEVVAITQIIDLLAEAPERLVVLDTAATGHFLRLLSTPEVLESWLRAIFRVLLKYRQTLRLPRLSDRLIALSRRVKKLRALLADPTRAQIWVLTLPTRMAEEEALDLVQSLEHVQLPPARLIVNQVSAENDGCPQCAALYRRERAILERWRGRGRPITIERGLPPIGAQALRTLGRQLLNSQARA